MCAVLPVAGRPKLFGERLESRHIRVETVEEEAILIRAPKDQGQNMYKKQERGNSNSIWFAGPTSIRHQQRAEQQIEYKRRTHTTSFICIERCWLAGWLGCTFNYIQKARALATV